MNKLKQIGRQTLDRREFYPQAKASLLQKTPCLNASKLLQNSYVGTNHSHHAIILHHSSDTKTDNNRQQPSEASS
jgi:hypothetical protein